MNLPKTRVLGCVCAFGLSACGTASVQYGEPLQSPTAAPVDSRSNSSVASILAAAAKGNQTLALPDSRLVVVGTVATVENGSQNGGDAQGAATPPPPAAPAAAPSHGAAASTTHPAQIGNQPAATAADQSGGKQTAKPANTTPAPSVTTTLTSTDGTTKYAVNVVQVESVVSFMVQPTNDFFSKNDFSVTRLANTRIPTTVSNTFTDETAARVKAIASIAAAVAPLAAAEAPPHNPANTSIAPRCLNEDMVVEDDALKPPASTPPSASAPNANLRAWSLRKTTWTHSGKCLDITLTADPLAPGLIPIASLSEAFAGKGGDWTKVWPVPACMKVRILITPPSGAAGSPKAAEGTMSLIDPDYVELMPVPQKGKIAMHPICGADLADTATDPYQADFDTINAIVAAFPAKKTSK